MVPTLVHDPPVVSKQSYYYTTVGYGVRKPGQRTGSFALPMTISSHDTVVTRSDLKVFCKSAKPIDTFKRCVPCCLSLRFLIEKRDLATIFPVHFQPCSAPCQTRLSRGRFFSFSCANDYAIIYARATLDQTYSQWKTHVGIRLIIDPSIHHPSVLITTY